MGLLEILTIVFIILKLTGVIAWSWWLVLLPTLITLGIIAVYLTVATVVLIVASLLDR